MGSYVCSKVRDSAYIQTSLRTSMSLVECYGLDAANARVVIKSSLYSVWKVARWREDNTHTACLSPELLISIEDCH